MERNILSLVILLGVFTTGYLLGVKSGCKYAWGKVVKYLKSKMPDEEAANIFLEIIKTK